MKKMLAAVALAAMFVGMLGGAASAHTGVQNVVVFVGKATVTPGLLLPTGPNHVTGTWNFNSSVACADLGGLGCSIAAAGSLAPVGGVGAACGISHGHSGTGSYGAAALSNVGWITSAGGSLPISGTYTLGGDTGPIVGLVQAQGGAPCATTGANSFDVVGVAVAL